MNFRTFIFLSSAFYPASVGTFMTTLIGILALQYENAFLSSVVFALPFFMTVFVAPLVARANKISQVLRF